MKNTIFFIILTAVIVCFTSCEKDKTNVEETISPTIEKFYSSRDTIEFGGDTTTLTVIAKGGNLEYIWDVDLGDLLPIDDGHKALFSGSNCCAETGI